MKFTVISPDGLPIAPEQYRSLAEAEAAPIHQFDRSLSAM